MEEAAVNDKSSPPKASTPVMNHRLFVNDERTVLVRLWSDDATVEVATRAHPAETWGPPVYLTEER